MRYISRVAGAIVLVGVLAPVHSHAFQEERVGGSSSTAQSAPAAGTTSSTSASEVLPGANITEQSTPESSSGTKLSIPGLGTVGVLPKMDFGLELLYGGDKAPQQQVEPEGDTDGLRIRGSIKHRF